MFRYSKLYLVLFVTVSFFSCTKSNKLIEETGNSKINRKTLEVSDFLNNTNDTLDQRVNYCLYDVALSLRTDIMDASIMSDLLIEADSNNGEVNIYNFLDNHSVLKDSFSHRLAILTGNSPENFNFKNYIDDHLEYDTIYQPYITIINIDTLNPVLSPIICVGAQIDENIWPGYEDNILQFIKGDGNVWSITSIGETAATTSSNPVVVVNNGLPSTGDIDIDKISTDVSPKTNSTANYYQDEIKLNYAYEKSGRIDYRIYTIYYKNSGYNTYLLSVVKSKSKIKRNKVGQSITLPFNITPIGGIPISTCNTGLCNVEWDWFQSLKYGGKICYPISNTIKKYNVRMKYINETYHFDGGVTGFDIPLYLPHSGSHYTVSNVNGYIKLSRLDQ